MLRTKRNLPNNGFSWSTLSTHDHYCDCITDPFRCPPGWRRHERLCYYFSDATDKRSWLDSEAACAAQGADLAFIGAAVVESFITSMHSLFYNRTKLLYASSTRFSSINMIGN